ncbi:MAG: carbohydrate ABC transporter permease, partial [Clostridia bacterium]|nr:carbohydrate ABC transporter permease [Clostridia bacterium]
MKMKLYKRALIWLLVLVVCFFILWPIYWIVKSSFTSNDKLYAMPVEYFSGWTLDSYRTLFGNTENTWQYIINTLQITLGTLALSTVLCALGGYAFARTKTKGIMAAFTFIVFSTMIPSTVTVIPLMVLMRTLKLTDTVRGLIILYFSAVIPFSVTMYSTFISQVPRALEEAAWIDGLTVPGAFFRIIFPLLKPVIATLCIINFITCVNEFFYPLIFTTRRVKVLSMLIYNVPRTSQWQDPWDTISASGCIMLLPTILFILFFEKN